MRPADCPHLWTADVHHLVADGESVWALLQPFNVLVHYDPTRRLCRAFLLDLPEDSQQIYGFAVDDKHVYLETGREVWKMGKE